MRATALARWDERIDAVLTRFEDARLVPDGRGHCEAQTLHGLLIREHGFAGSYQTVRRIELPAGVQAQHDWFDFESVTTSERYAPPRVNRDAVPLSGEPAS